jgi:acetylornithine deacetylase/succinyl-diaminopimelate desuccinylase-like protein
MVDTRAAAIQYARDHAEQNLDILKELLRIPSISTDPDHTKDMAIAAEWLAERLKILNFSNIQIFPTAKHPIVYGEYLISPSLPTVLIYGHYDVQPPEPLDLWQSPPFQPTRRNGNLYARGASDMKGQVVATLSAVTALLNTGKPPLNFKYILEGEEEIGSPNLPEFLKAHEELLRCSIALNPDSGMVGADFPTIVYALRGLAYFELRVIGPAHDLHSGVYGGVVQNPAIVLSELISGMHDAQGRVTLQGFYDRVRPLSEDERRSLARLPMTDEKYKQLTGVPELWGENGYSAVERAGARPTLDVNGLYSGFIGEGSKTVIPSWAMAKISMRLVPDQRPADVEAQLRQYLVEHAPKTVKWELTTFASGEAVLVDINHPAVKALFQALEKVWGTQPVYKRDGGSVPVVLDMRRILGIESVLTGFGLPDDNLHAPNEKLDLPTWYRGIEALIHFFYNLAGSKD